MLSLDEIHDLAVNAAADNQPDIRDAARALLHAEIAVLEARAEYMRRLLATCMEPPADTPGQS